MLVLLYYFSQNPQFAESVKPLMEKLKDSQQMLDFLNDLSKFAETFSVLKQEAAKNAESSCDDKKQTAQKEENPQSPTAGIADKFIEEIVNGYLNKK